MNKRNIDKLQQKSLSNHDVLKLVDDKASLYTYPELVQFNNIDDLLGPWEACIILYLTSHNYGHWVCVFKQNKNTISFFDSYGLMPDDELKFTPLHFRLNNNQYFSHLTWLLYKSPYKVDYNDHKLQSKKRDITTCGRWVAARLILRNLTNDKFAKLFKVKNIKPDSLVTAFTSNF